MSSEQPGISRRDLFRGRFRAPEPPETPPDEPALGPLETPPSTPVPAAPIPRDSTDSPDVDLPPVTEATISTEELEALLRDIRLCATEVTLVNRGGPEIPASANDDLRQRMDALFRAIESGAARAAQIRYRWNDVRWIDTLSQIPGGIRLIRVGHPV